jgi:hypothetical protein
MSSVLCPYTGYSPPISSPQVFVCSSPDLFTHMSPQDPRLLRSNLDWGSLNLGSC